MLVAGEDHPGRSASAPAYLGPRTVVGSATWWSMGCPAGAGRGGPLGLSRPSSRGWRQCLLGSRPRRGASAWVDRTQTRGPG